MVTYCMFFIKADSLPKAYVELTLNRLEGELDKNVVVSKMEIDTQHGAITGQTTSEKFSIWLSLITFPVFLAGNHWIIK